MRAGRRAEHARAMHSIRGAHQDLDLTRAAQKRAERQATDSPGLGVPDQ